MTQRTSGRTVTEDTELISNTREKLAAGHMRSFIDNMQELGYDTGEIRELLAKMQS
jgi:DNA-binding transcriptional regulator YhcF (GntR family)